MKTINLTFPEAVEQAIKCGYNIKREHWKIQHSITYDTSDERHCRFYEEESGKAHFFTKEDYLAADWEIVTPKRTMTFLEAINCLQEYGRIVQRQGTKIAMWISDRGKLRIRYPEQTRGRGLFVEDIEADDWIEAESI